MRSFLETLGTAAPACFAVAGFLATGLLIGRLVLGSRLHRPAPETWVLSVTLGIDLLVILAMPLLWLDWLSNAAVQAGFALGLASAAAVLLWHLRSWMATKRSSSSASLPLPWHLLPFAVLAFILLKNAFLYPHAQDDLTYQLAVPLRWMTTGSLTLFLDNPFSGFPGANLVGNLLLLKAGGILAPPLFNHVLGIVLSVATYFLLREDLAPWPASIFTLSFALSLCFLGATTSAYAEPWILLQVTALLFLWRRLTRPNSAIADSHALAAAGPESGRVDWLLVGVFAGFAAAVKLTGFIVPVAACLVATGAFGKTSKSVRPPEDSPRERRRRFLLLLTPVLLITLLFYSRPFLATGNPVYPYFASLFTDRVSSQAMSEYHHAAGKLHFGPDLDSPWEAAMLFVETPILLSVAAALDLAQGPAAVYDGFFGLQALVLLGLVAAWLVAAYRRGNRGQDAHPQRTASRLRLYGGLGVVFYVFWFFTSQQARFLLPGYLCLVLAVGSAFNTVCGKRAAVVLGALLVLTLVSLPLPYLGHFVAGWQAVADSRLTPLNLLHSRIGDEYLQACQGILQNTPADAKVLLLYEQRGLYVPRDYVIGTPYFQEKLFTPPENIAGDAAFLEALRAEKITHALVAFVTKDPDRMQEYMQKAEPFLARLYSKGGLIERGVLKTVWTWPPNRAVEYGLYQVVYEKS